MVIKVEDSQFEEEKWQQNEENEIFRENET